MALRNEDAVRERMYARFNGAVALMKDELGACVAVPSSVCDGASAIDGIDELPFGSSSIVCVGTSSSSAAESGGRTRAFDMAVHVNAAS